MIAQYFVVSLVYFPFLQEICFFECGLKSPIGA
jgi:hypothetical protein